MTNMYDKELQLSELEKKQLIQFYKEEALPSFKVDNETPEDESDSFWYGIQFDKRMFDLCVYWADYKIVCVVYECDPTEDGYWTTNMTASWHLSDEETEQRLLKKLGVGGQDA